MKKGFFIILAALLAVVACDRGDAPPVGAKERPVISVTEKVEHLSEDAPPAAEPSEIAYNEYSVTLDINPKTGMVNGLEKVIFYNKTGDTLNNICFNLYLNAFSQEAGYQPYFNEFRDYIFANGRDYGYINVTSVYINDQQTDFSTDITILDISLEKPLAPMDELEITIQFEAYIPKINHRTGSNDNAMWFGSFLPVLAVYEDGVFRSDPYYRAGDPFYVEAANYTVSINAPKNYDVIAPGAETVREDQNQRNTTFTSKIIREFSFALVDRSYRKISVTTEGGVEVNLYYRSRLLNVDTLITSAREALNFYSSYIGGYPYEKYDIVEVGMFFPCGMEYSQLTFIDSNYLKEPAAISAIAHEIGHQWFYGAVGSDQIRYPWLDEALVTYLQQKMSFTELAKLQAKFEKDYTGLDEKNLSPLLLSDDLSVYKSWSDYYNIQYLKGSIMIYSMNMKMGEEKFQEFIRKYYADFSFKTASVQDFIYTAEQVWGTSLESFFQNWIYEERLPPLYD